MGTFMRQYAPGRPQKVGGEETPLDRCRPTMNGTQPDDTDDPESIDTDEERSLSPLRDGAQRIKNPPRAGTHGTATIDQDDATPLFTTTGHYLEDEEGQVQVIISVAAAEFRLTLDTGTARVLAADLVFAARGAEDPDEVKHEL
jgi:hypothetical protein